MRTVLLIAVALLLVALGLERELPVPETVDVVSEPVRQDQAVRVFSRGWSFPHASHGDRKVARGFVVDSIMYRHADGDVGLSALELPPGGGVAEVALFDLRNNVGDGLRFSQYLDRIEVGSVVLLSSSTGIGAIGGEYSAYDEAVSGVFRRVGARSKPTASRLQSFAHICYRLEDGSFRAVAEALSHTKGISLAYVIPGDRERLLEHEPEHLVDDRKLTTLDLAEASLEGARSGVRHRLAERAYDCTEIDASSEASLVSWSFAAGELPEQDGSPVAFSARIGLKWSKDEDLLGARFSLSIDGRPVGETVLWNQVGSAGQWVLWEEALPRSTEPIQSLTIEVQALGPGEAEGLTLIAEPMLVSGHVYGI